MGLPASVLDNELLRDFFADAEAKGQAKVLRALLEEKFGPLPEWAVARIEGGAAAQADVWAKKVLKARSLEAVIGRK